MRHIFAEFEPKMITHAEGYKISAKWTLKL